MQLRPEPFDSPDARFLIAAQQAEVRARGDTGDTSPPREAAMFTPPDGVFLIARAGGSPYGCGGLCRLDTTRAELKRMYVAPEARGRGVGRLLLERLEAEARALGYTAIVLETIDLMREAIRLYASSGYTPIPCFGAYVDSEVSRCFEKHL